jgi:hypothetical protein
MGASIAPPHTLLASIELAKARWVITALATGSSKMSRHEVTGGDGAGLLELLRRLRNKAEQRLGTKVSIVTIQEAGIDGCSPSAPVAQKWGCELRSDLVSS